MGYRIVQTAVGWLLYASGEQLGVYDTAGEVFATAAFVMQSRTQPEHGDDSWTEATTGITPGLIDPRPGFLKRKFSRFVGDQPFEQRDDLLLSGGGGVELATHLDKAVVDAGEALVDVIA